MNKYDILSALMNKENRPAKDSSPIKTFFAIVGVIAVVAGIVYAIYRFLTPDYLKDLDSDFDDDFDDFFEDETDAAGEKIEEAAEDVKEAVEETVEKAADKFEA